MSRCKAFGISVVGFALVVMGLAATLARATETENFNMQVLPAPGKVAIDGKFDDWDLTAGIFCCYDAETLRDKHSMWYHAMYDAENLYVLARWTDPTPINNPGVKGDMGFMGDCLQFRTVTTDGAGREKTAHMTFWKLREGGDLMDICYGKSFNEGGFPDAKTEGAKQAFAAYADRKGYVQEIAVPWKLLTADKQPLKAGAKFVMTIEPNAVAVPRDGKVLKFSVKNCPDRAAGWFYVSWLPDQPRAWDARDWARLEAVPGSNGEFTCAIPESLGAFDWFGGITFTLKAGTFAQPMSLSTKIYRCGEGPAK